MVNNGDGFTFLVPREFGTQIPDSQLPWKRFRGVGSLQHPPTKRKLEMTVVKRSEIYWNIYIYMYTIHSEIYWNI